MRIPRNRRARPCGKVLKGREAPAGNVTQAFVNNTLAFTGDGNLAGNQVRVPAVATTAS